MTKVKVHNLNGTKDFEPKDGETSWLTWWESKSGKTAILCSNCDCIHPARVGGHVQKDGSDTTDKWFIVPLCYGCNGKSSSFEVPQDSLVAVND